MAINATGIDSDAVRELKVLDARITALAAAIAVLESAPAATPASPWSGPLNTAYLDFQNAFYARLADADATQAAAIMAAATAAINAA